MISSSSSVFSFNMEIPEVCHRIFCNCILYHAMPPRKLVCLVKSTAHVQVNYFHALYHMCTHFVSSSTRRKLDTGKRMCKFTSRSVNNKFGLMHVKPAQQMNKYLGTETERKRERECSRCQIFNKREIGRH